MLSAGNKKYVEDPKITLTNDLVLYHPDFKRTVKQKSNNTFRIIFIGDSIARGINVPNDLIFSSLLENKLNKGTIKSEVLNFAVPGYNLLEIYEVFQEHVKVSDPDLVIYSNYIQDHLTTEIIDINDSLYSYAAWNKQILYLIKLPFNNFLLRNYKTYRLFNIHLINLLMKINIEPDVSFYYLSIEKTSRALNDVAEYLRQEQIPFLIVKHPSLVSCKSNDFIEQHMDEENRKYTFLVELGNYLENHDCENLGLALGDDHLSEKGHEVVAEIIYQELINNKLIPVNISDSD